MMKNLLGSVVVLFFFLCGSGCATVFKGSYTDVPLLNAPQGLRVFTQEGVEIKIDSIAKAENQGGEWSKAPKLMRVEKTLRLVSRKTHVLVLKFGEKEKRVELTPTVEPLWLVIDTVLLFYPAIIDAITGNWYEFEPIRVMFE
jgi:hypothetical protein